MRKHLIIANWKSNPVTLREAIMLAKKTESEISECLSRIKSGGRIEIVVSPPFPFMESVGKILKKTKLGAQNVFWESGGPYTGEVSPPQLMSLGVKYVIIGHSERKIHLGETDEMINKKMRAVIGGGLSPILCVGERERPDNDIPPEVGDQLKNALREIPGSAIENLTVCYEPVWAISTRTGSKADTPESAFRAGLYLRRILTGLYGRKTAEQARIIYGGSVSAENAASFVAEGRMRGVLVGGASLRPDEFVAIVRNIHAVSL